MHHTIKGDFHIMKKIKWGIIGTGWIADKMAEALPFVQNAELHAVASRSSEKSRSFADKYKIPKAYGSYEELACDPEIDAVYIATPHNLHCENTLLALSHGKNVLCEKPFAVNGREVRSMIKKAEEKNVFLMEALWSRFLPNFIKAKEIIESGQIGKVKLLAADFGVNVPFDPTHRIYNKELIGGSLLDLGIYPLFLALSMLGKPERVHAAAAIGATDVDYTCSITLGYDDDSLAVMYSSCIAKSDVVATIHGEKGKIVFDKWWFTPVPIHLYDAEGKEVPLTFDFTGNGYNYESSEVCRCLSQGLKQSPMMTHKDSLLLIDTMDEIRRQIGLTYPGHD